MTRRKFTSKFKTKVVLEALKERQTVKELAQKFEITPQQIGTWKRDFLKEADTVFSKGEKSKKSEAEEKKDQLLKVIGELKVENDFLK
ncbi:transposase, partial [Salegentibacter salarius]